MVVCSNQLEVLDVFEGRVHSISLPLKLKYVFLVAEDRWLLLESVTNKYELQVFCQISLNFFKMKYNVTHYVFIRKFLLTKPMHMAPEDSGVCQLHSITEDLVSSGKYVKNMQPCHLCFQKPMLALIQTISSKPHVSH